MKIHAKYVLAIMSESIYQQSLLGHGRGTALPCPYMREICYNQHPSPKPLLDGLKKYDLEKGTAESYFFGRGRFGGECVFVPRPGASVEDDGWVITYVHDTITNKSELLILNAQNITAGPVAQVMLPQRVPYGFHCGWVSSEQMAFQKI